MQIILAITLVVVAIALFLAKRTIKNEDLERAANIGGIIATVLALLVLAFYTASLAPKEPQGTPTPVITQTLLPVDSPVALAEDLTSTQTPERTSSATWTATPSPTLETSDKLIQLVDAYYNCFNIANPGIDSDYERCWDLLSDRPGEFQSYLDKGDFISFWKKYKVTYALYYCPKGLQSFVDAEYYLYDRNDLSVPIGDGSVFYLEYSFALDENGWRIKGADPSTNRIGSYCEVQPRIEKLTLLP